jgi:hypothetical protein
MAAKDERGDLRPAGPQVRKADELTAKAQAALDVFKRFTRAAKRNALDARFWGLAASETAFRVELFKILMRTYYSRKEGAAADETLADDVDVIVEKGNALYDVARDLWAKLLPPQTLDEEIYIRWDRVKDYLTMENT